MTEAWHRAIWVVQRFAEQSINDKPLCNGRVLEMSRTVALAVDLGASGGRIVSGAFDGRLLELKELHRFENGPVSFGGQLVWDFVGLWSGVLDGLRIAAD